MLVAEMPENNDENNNIENIKSCDAVLLFLEREMRKQEDMDSMINYLTVMTILASVRRDLAVGTTLDGKVSLQLNSEGDKPSVSEVAARMMRELGHEH